jgi:large subunit ribosomal protein L21
MSAKSHHANKYAIIKSGGKQYRVAEEDIIEVELLDAEIGGKVEFQEILFICDGSTIQVGKPAVGEYLVHGELLDIVGGPKVTSIKYKPSHHQYRKFGHRQHYARVKITGIESRKEKGKHHGT